MSQWCFVSDIDIQYEAPIRIVSANLESPRPMAVQCAFGAEIFFLTFFWCTKCRVGDDGCAIFLFVKKTRHSIRCPFSYLLRKWTTYECVSFSYPQNPPVDSMNHTLLKLFWGIGILVNNYLGKFGVTSLPRIPIFIKNNNDPFNWRVELISGYRH